MQFRHNVDQTHWVSIHVYFFCQTRTKINRLCKFYRQEVCKCLKLAHFEVTCIYLNSRSGETSCFHCVILDFCINNVLKSDQTFYYYFDNDLIANSGYYHYNIFDLLLNTGNMKKQCWSSLLRLVKMGRGLAEGFLL